jgi:hypothetical protein
MLIGTYVQLLYYHFTAVHTAPGVFKISAALTDRLYFRPGKLNAAFKAFEHKIFMKSFFVGGYCFCVFHRRTSREIQYSTDAGVFQVNIVEKNERLRKGSAGVRYVLTFISPRQLPLRDIRQRKLRSCSTCQRLSRNAQHPRK